MFHYRDIKVSQQKNQVTKNQRYRKKMVSIYRIYPFSRDFLIKAAKA